MQSLCFHFRRLLLLLSCLSATAPAASEAFKAGQCDGVLISGLRARSYIPVTGSSDYGAAQ